jgi:hypothetical protein
MNRDIGYQLVVGCINQADEPHQVQIVGLYRFNDRQGNKIQK